MGFAKKSRLLLFRIILVSLGLSALSAPSRAADQQAIYVGTEVCKGCHEAQVDRFMASSKKAKSYASIQNMQAKLTPAEFKDCFKCHTTGYGEAGGFKSAEETPDLKNLGCEACHGPGSLHAESGDPTDLAVKVNLQVCSPCHNSERIAAFGFKPILHAGAH